MISIEREEEKEKKDDKVQNCHKGNNNKNNNSYESNGRDDDKEIDLSIATANAVDVVTHCDRCKISSSQKQATADAHVRFTPCGCTTCKVCMIEFLFEELERVLDDKTYYNKLKKQSFFTCYNCQSPIDSYAIVNHTTCRQQKIQQLRQQLKQKIKQKDYTEQQDLLQQIEELQNLQNIQQQEQKNCQQQQEQKRQGLSQQTKQKEQLPQQQQQQQQGQKLTGERLLQGLREDKNSEHDDSLQEVKEGASKTHSSNITCTDVLFGRGSHYFLYAGNGMLRQLARAKQGEYLKASKSEKASIALEIVKSIRGLTPPGRFLRRDDKEKDLFVEVGDGKARERASQILREVAAEVRKELRENKDSEQDPKEEKENNNGSDNGTGIDPSIADETKNHDAKKKSKEIHCSNRQSTIVNHTTCEREKEKLPQQHQQHKQLLDSQFDCHYHIGECDDDYSTEKNGSGTTPSTAHKTGDETSQVATQGEEDISSVEHSTKTHTEVGTKKASGNAGFEEMNTNQKATTSSSTRKRKLADLDSSNTNDNRAKTRPKVKGKEDDSGFEDCDKVDNNQLLDSDFDGHCYINECEDDRDYSKENNENDTTATSMRKSTAHKTCGETPEVASQGGENISSVERLIALPTHNEAGSKKAPGNTDSEEINTNQKSATSSCNTKKRKRVDLDSSNKATKSLSSDNDLESDETTLKKAPSKRKPFSERLSELRAHKEMYNTAKVKQCQNRPLYRWLKDIHNGRYQLSEEQRKQLDALGGDVDPSNTAKKSFNERLDDLRAYKQKHGTIQVKKCHDHALVTWLYRIRGRDIKLSEDQWKQLNAVAEGEELTSRPRKSFEQRLLDLIAHKELHGTTTQALQSQDSSLHNWLSSIRTGNMKLDAEQRQKIEDLGFSLVSTRKRENQEWDENIKKYVEYHAKTGKFEFPDDYPDKSLVEFVNKNLANKRLSQSRSRYKSTLEKIGFFKHGLKNPRRTFEERVKDLIAFKEAYGHTQVPWKWKENLNLSYWVSRVRAGECDLSREQRKTLNQIGFNWETHANKFNREWNISFSKLKDYKRQHGSCRVPWQWSEDQSLSNWVHTQRKEKSKGKMREDREKLLNSIGFIWAPSGRNKVKETGANAGGGCSGGASAAILDINDAESTGNVANEVAENVATNAAARQKAPHSERSLAWRPHEQQWDEEASVEVEVEADEDEEEEEERQQSSSLSNVETGANPDVAAANNILTDFASAVTEPMHVDACGTSNKNRGVTSTCTDASTSTQEALTKLTKLIRQQEQQQLQQRQQPMVQHHLQYPLRQQQQAAVQLHQVFDDSNEFSLAAAALDPRYDGLL